jgi:hypothetical protein
MQAAVIKFHTSFEGLYLVSCGRIATFCGVCITNTSNIVWSAGVQLHTKQERRISCKIMQMLRRSVTYILPGTVSDLSWNIIIIIIIIPIIIIHYLKVSRWLKEISYGVISRFIFENKCNFTENLCCHYYLLFSIYKRRYYVKDVDGSGIL